MPIITVSGPAVVFDCSADDEDGMGVVVADVSVLATLHGLKHDEVFTDYIGDGDDQTLANAGLSGGLLRFEFDSNSGRLIGITEYVAARILADRELKLLKEYTMGQWSDGIGSNFFQLRDSQEQLAPQLVFMDADAVSIEQRS